MGKLVGGSMVAVGDTQLFLRRWGSEDGRPILFFHSLGASASAALLDVGMGPLADAGHAIAAPDMPGYGESPPMAADQYAIPRLAELGIALADTLGWDRFVLGGHSWGGAIAVHLAAAHPERVRALVLVDSGHLDYGDTPQANLDASLEQLIEESEGQRIRVRDRAHVASDLELDIDDPVVDSYMAGLMDDGEGGLIARTLGSTRGAAMYHLTRSRQSEQWASIAAAGTPTLLLLATVPDFARAANEAAAARFGVAISHADIRLIEGASHSLITDLRATFGETVRDWLASLD
jgi:pimeloyl-ACP methyl ester carboxylesterase